VVSSEPADGSAIPVVSREELRHQRLRLGRVVEGDSVRELAMRGCGRVKAKNAAVKRPGLWRS